MSLCHILYEEFFQWEWTMDMVLGVLRCLWILVEATSLLPCLQKENVVSIAACTFPLQSKEPERQNRLFPWKILFTTLITFLCFAKEVLLSLDLHTHIPLRFLPSSTLLTVTFLQGEDEVWRKMTCAFSSCFFSFLLSCLYKDWMNFWWFCVPVSCLLIVFQ